MFALLGSVLYAILTWSVWIVMAYFVLNGAIHLTRGVLRTKRRVDGKVIVVTGANQGIGYETALELVRRGGHVILACRNRARAEAAKKRIEDTLESESAERPKKAGAQAQLGRVTFIQLDLCSFASVHRFVAELSSLVDQVDILINNAGIVPSGKQRVCTEDGLEETFQANYIGHFLLTNELMPLLRKSPQARIVNITSLLYLLGKVDPSRLERLVNGTGNVPMDIRYNHTKLAIVMWTRELARRLKGSSITANCVHPGLVKTQIAAEKPTLFARTIYHLSLWFGKNSLEGAQTQLHVAISDVGAKVSGGYFEDCRRLPLLRGTDPATNQELWEVTEHIIKSAETRKMLND